MKSITIRWAVILSGFILVEVEGYAVLRDQEGTVVRPVSSAEGREIPEIWETIFSFLGETEALTKGSLVSKTLNAAAQSIAIRHDSEHRWPDGPKASEIKAHLHDKNFDRGFDLFMTSYDVARSHYPLVPHDLSPNDSETIRMTRDEIARLAQRVEPQSSAQYFLLGAVAYLNKQTALADTYWKSARLIWMNQIGGDCPRTLDILSQIYINEIGVKGDLTLARTYAKKAQEIVSQDQPSKNRFPLWLKSVDKLKHRDLRFEILRMKDDDPSLREKLEELLSNPFANRNDRRLAVFEYFLMGEYTKSADFYESILAEGPNSIEDLRLASEAFSKSKRMVRYVEILEKILTLPEHKLSDEREAAAGNYVIGLRSRSTQIYENVLREVNEHSSDLYKDLYWAAELERNRKNYPHAAQLYERALRFPDATVDLKRRAAESYAGIGEYNQAITLLEGILNTTEPIEADKTNLDFCKIRSQKVK